MREKVLRSKLEAGHPVIGTWSLIPSVISTEILARSGMDFVVLDSEHGPLSFETAQAMMIACEAHDVSPVMRISGIHAQEMQKALDIGAHCVHVPNVNTRAQAEECVRYLKYPPLGQRGFSPFTRAASYGRIAPKEVVAEANGSLLLAIHIEDEKGVENIASILSVKGVDIVFIGLFDLSKSLGIPGEVTHPRVLQMLQSLTKQILAAGKYPGTIVMNEAQLQQALEYGLKYITYSVDSQMLRSVYESVVKEFQAMKGACVWNSV